MFDQNVSRMRIKRKTFYNTFLSKDMGTHIHVYVHRQTDTHIHNCVI